MEVDAPLRRVCGFERRADVPSESVFSRAFAEFSALELPQKLHEALIQKTQKDRIVGHISRDATAIEARERPKKKQPRKSRKKQNVAVDGLNEERSPQRNLLDWNVKAP